MIENLTQEGTVGFVGVICSGVYDRKSHTRRNSWFCGVVCSGVHDRKSPRMKGQSVCGVVCFGVHVIKSSSNKEQLALCGSLFWCSCYKSSHM